MKSLTQSEAGRLAHAQIFKHSFGWREIEGCPKGPGVSNFYPISGFLKPFLSK
jgi:hypothetical protein